MHVLLVHGAFHDERCWDALRPHLESQGVEVSSVTLSGHGNRRDNAFRLTMQSYAQDVCDKAEQIGKPCVLLGHSMGGAVISVAAQTRPELFARMIYLTAFVPRMREKSLLALRAVAPAKAMDNAVRLSLLKGSAKIDSQAAATVFYNTCTPEVAAQAASGLCLEPLRPSFSSLEWTADRLGMIPKYYVECTGDRAIPIAGQRALQQHMDFAGVATLPSDHSPFLSMPQRLAEVIVRFASASVR